MATHKSSYSSDLDVGGATAPPTFLASGELFNTSFIDALGFITLPTGLT